MEGFKIIQIVCQILIGFFLADFVSGFGHWIEDTYLSYCTKIPLLSGIAKDNEMHHYYPRLIVSCSTLESMQVTTPLVLVFYSIIYIFFKTHMFTYRFLYATMFPFLLFTNIIHKFAHMRDCEKNSILKFLQKIGLFCSSKEHHLHHTIADKKYCVNTNYLNPILDNLGFWKLLEFIISLFGIQITRKKPYNGYSKTYVHKNTEKTNCPPIINTKEKLFLHEKLNNSIRC